MDFHRTKKKLKWFCGKSWTLGVECVLQRLCTSGTPTEPCDKYSDCWFDYVDSLGGIGVAQE